MRSRLVPGALLTAFLLLLAQGLSGPAAHARPLLAPPLPAPAAVSGDSVPPTVSEVSSTDFPASGSGSSPLLHVGQPGTFTLGAADTGGGVRRIEWTLAENAFSTGSRPPTTISSGWRTVGLLPSVTITVTVTPAHWGSNTLLVRAFDRSGNKSQATTYSFDVPTDPDYVPRDGDVTADGIPDVLAVDTAGDLRVYPGRVGGTIGASYVASAAAQAPGPSGWSGAIVAHRGSTTAGGPDGLIVWSGGTLSAYSNNGIGYFQSDGASNVTHPRCDICIGYPTDWSQLTAMVALGDVLGGPRSSLLTVEAGQLWLYARFGPSLVSVEAISLAGVDLLHSDLIAPGDATGDGRADLWVRDRIRGSITQFAGTATGLDPEGTPVARRGLSGATFSVATSVGDLSGDGVPDLLTVNPAGSLQIRGARTPFTPTRIAPPSFGARNVAVENEIRPTTGR